MDAPSPFSPHFGTNYVPVDDEVSAICQIINSHRISIDDIEKRMQELQERRQLHTKAIEQHSTLLSPIKRVQTDILVSIFLACLPQRPSPHSTITSRLHPALVISHVCRCWRSIALSLPVLWSTIHIVSLPVPRLHSKLRGPNRSSAKVGAKDPEVWKGEVAEYEKKLQMVKEATLMWLERSANCLLDITFTSDDLSSKRPTIPEKPEKLRREAMYLCVGGLLSAQPQSPTHPPAPPSPSPVSESFNSIMTDLLLDVSARWKRASLNLTIAQSNSPLLRMLRVTPDDVPQLEEVQLLLPNISSPTLKKAGLILQKGSPASNVGLLEAPRLHSLSLSPTWAPADQLPINWLALTELYLGPYYLSAHLAAGHVLLNSRQALTVLTACRNLIRCFLTLESNPNTPKIELPLRRRVVLPYLISMSIQGSYLPNGLASSLALPSLRKLLILSTGLSPQNETKSAVVDWVANFGDMLTEMTFEHSSLTQSALLYVLARLPNVETLRMVDTGTVDEIGPDQMDSESEWNPMSQTMQRGDPPRSAVINDSVLWKFIPGTPAMDCYCPRLRSFSCRMTEVEFTENALVDFIVARRRPPTNTTAARLERVVVKFSKARKMDIKKELESRSSNSMDLDLGHFVLVTKYGGVVAHGIDEGGDNDDLHPEDRLVLGTSWAPNCAEWW
ncbi:hypothetical protein EST38_g8222 [Candolleomyces aberdarensis]|uniref:F-box domain-containing protein n=1 Tax=Candolleomyces aberdarensis TaxID=2316362 RepID=A0A4Q2DFY2_9AGAR|nr:hypothetical protein EST38_g8222 [Candolleomyces aberdarensis]